MRPSYLPWLLIPIGVVLFLNSLSCPFFLDDLQAIVDNKHIRHLWPPDWFFSAPPHGALYGRPVVSFTVALNYAFGRLVDVRGYHALNVAVHVTCAALMFGVVRRTLLGKTLRRRFGRGGPGIAFICALLWMVHPLQTECINYISQRSESIMSLFYLLTLYCAIRANEKDRRYPWHGAAWVACALGMATKEVMATAPLMVVLYDSVFRSGPMIDVWRKRWRFYAGLAGTWFILAALLWAYPKTQTGFSLPVTPWLYAKNQCLMVVNYLKLTVWPYPLVADYGFTQPLSIGDVSLEGSVLLALLIATTMTFFYRPPVAFLGAWFFILLSLTSSFYPLPAEVGAERRMYLALAGPIVLVVTIGYALLQTAIRWPVRAETSKARWLKHPPSLAVTAVVVTIATVLSVTSYRRNRDYQRPLTIWQTVVDEVPNNPRALNNFGLALRDEGKSRGESRLIDQAISCFRQAAEQRPELGTPHANLGDTLAQRGEFHEAIVHYRQALRIWPRYPDAHHSLGNALRSLGRLDEAIKHYRKTLELSGDDAKAHYHLAGALRQRGQFDEAVNHYYQAVSGEPNNVIFQYDLGVVLGFQGKTDVAILHYRRALSIDPDYKAAHYNLGVVLGSQGKTDEAILHYRQALSIDPDYAAAHYNLGTALANRGQLDESIRHFRQAVQIKADFVEAHYYLGKALSMRSLPRAAMEHFERAMRLKPDWPKPINDQAWILATHPDSKVRQPEEAVRLARRAAELTQRQDPSILDTLAAAYAAAGQFDAAIATAEQAIRLASAAGKNQRADHIGQRLELYRQANPYRQPVSESEDLSAPKGS